MVNQELLAASWKIIEKTGYAINITNNNNNFHVTIIATGFFRRLSNADSNALIADMQLLLQ